MRAMFARARVRSLKTACFQCSDRASERDRTRTNAEPCHSCHGSRRTREVSRCRSTRGEFDPMRDFTSSATSLPLEGLDPTMNSQTCALTLDQSHHLHKAADLEAP